MTIEKECMCGGEPDQSERFMAAAAGKDFKVWIQFTGSMSEITAAETRRRAIKGLSELAAPCGLSFTIVNTEREANIRIYYRPNSGMMNSGGAIALGLAWSNGTVYINSERLVGNLDPTRRIVEAVHIHEVMHVLKFKHVEDKGCIMHPWLTSTTLCKSEIVSIQGKYGTPLETWYPVDRGIVGTRINTIIKHRQALIAERDGSTDKAFRTIKQNANLLLMREQISLSTEWFRLNNEYRGLPGAHVG